MQIKIVKFILIFLITLTSGLSQGTAATTSIPTDVCNTALGAILSPKDFSHQIFVPTEKAIPPQEAGTIRIMQFNVENLFEMAGHHDIVAPHTYKLDTSRPPKSKPEWKLRWIMEVTKNISPDFAVWEEVEDIDAMKYAQQKYGLPGYTPYLIRGNDGRGINIGMWVKDGLYDVRYETNKDVQWHDPVTNKDIPVFSRDVPALIISDKESAQPKLIILGNHEKSQRDRPGDPGSQIWRAAQYKALDELANEKYRTLYGPNIAILAAGDFNADVQKSPESQELNKDFVSAFAVAHETNAPNQIITQTFFPRGGTPVQSQLDDIKILKGSPVQVIRALVVRYHNLSGNIIPLPSSFAERQKEPSDHLPIIADIKL